jgi:riboflavin biosynthesis pyrimidine reductase
MLAVLGALGRRRVIQAMWEGGPSVHASLLSADAADLLVTYVGNCLLGSSAIPWARAPLAATIAEKREWHLRGCEALGKDVRLTYTRRPPPGYAEPPSGS